MFIHNDEKSWRFSRSRFNAEVDTMLTIGVGHEMMTLTKKRLIPIGSFGGASKRLLGKLLSSQSFRETDRFTRLNGPWVPSLATYVVALAGEKQQAEDNEPAAKPVVHVSYAWGGESEELVDQLETKFSASYTFRRDRAAMRSGDWVSKFIAEIGQSQCVLVVFSEKYLKSSYCMRELLHLHQSSLGDKAAMLERIVPIVLGDAKIDDAVARLNVARHWKAERERLELATQGLNPLAWGDTTRNELLRIHDFEHHSADMLAWVADVLMPRGAAAVSAGNFQAVVDLLQQRLKS